MSTVEKTNHRAVVIGASLAGLLAARVLHETFDQVIVLDRDALPERPQPRRGVPQGGHVHGLLARGRQSMDELFEGLSAELISLGALSCDVQEQMQWWSDGRPLARGKSGMMGLAVSRSLLEFTIRRRVGLLPNVEILPDHAVTDLLTSSHDESVTGVVATTSSGDHTLIEDIDLVVDASGRGSRARHWLAQLGYPKVDEEQIEIQVTYVTRRYRRESDQLNGRYGTAVATYPGKPRGGFVLAQEDDTWIVAVQGWFGAVPPTDNDGLVAWAEDLDCQDVATIMRTATPISEPIRMRYPASTRLRYDKLNRFPSGFLVMGDALCSFNPIYGQGMTVAALEASALGRILQSGKEDLSRRFFAAAADIIDFPWAAVRANDLRFPEAVGDRSMLDSESAAYLLRLRTAAADDPELATALLRVLHLMDPPSALFAPAVAARIPA